MLVRPLDGSVSKHGAVRHVESLCHTGCSMSLNLCKPLLYHACTKKQSLLHDENPGLFGGPAAPDVGRSLRSPLGAKLFSVAWSLCRVRIPSFQRTNLHFTRKELKAKQGTVATDVETCSKASQRSKVNLLALFSGGGVKGLFWGGCFIAGFLF